jgi:hypothetical protein
VLPAGTVMLDGIDAMAELPLTMLKVTTVSLTSARVNVTLPRLLAPPITELGVNVTWVGEFGFTVNVACELPPLAEALICTGVETATEFVTIVHVILFAP